MKGKLRLLTILLQFTLIFSIVGCGTSLQNNNQGNYSGSITVWSWNDELKTSGIIDKFNKAYPDVTINLVTIPNDNSAYSTKLMATLKSGIRTPDVFLSESAVVKKMCNTDYYENLSEEPYDAEDLTKDMVPYTVALGRNENDNSLRALTWQATPGGFFYRKSIAKKYLGTDEPDKIREMMSTPDKVIQTGNIVSSKSNGSVKLFSTYEELQHVILGSRKTGWVKDGKLVIDPKMNEYLDYAKRIKDSGLECGQKQWSDGWTASMEQGNVLGYMLPTWGVSGVLKVNAPDTSGDWAFCRAETPYYWGGTWLGIYKGSKKKELSYLFVKYITSNTDFLKSYAEEAGDFVNNTKVQDEIANSSDNGNEFVGGQNLYKEYSELVKEVDGSTLTEYDEDINNIWAECTKEYTDGLLTKEQTIADFKNKVKQKDRKIEVQ